MSSHLHLIQGLCGEGLRRSSSNAPGWRLNPWRPFTLHSRRCFLTYCCWGLQQVMHWHTLLLLLWLHCWQCQIFMTTEWKTTVWLITFTWALIAALKLQEGTINCNNEERHVRSAQVWSGHHRHFIPQVEIHQTTGAFLVQILWYKPGKLVHAGPACSHCTQTHRPQAQLGQPQRCLCENTRE